MSMAEWKIEYHLSASGKSPIVAFIEDLTPRAQAKLINTFELMKEFGNRIGSPHIKKLIGSPLWEIRILGQNNIRIIYFIPKEKTFLLIHGFIKKTQKTPLKEIRVALKRLKEY